MDNRTRVKERALKLVLYPQLAIGRGCPVVLLISESSQHVSVSLTRQLLTRPRRAQELLCDARISPSAEAMERRRHFSTRALLVPPLLPSEKPKLGTLTW